MGYEFDGKRWCDCGDALTTPQELEADRCEFCQWWEAEKDRISMDMQKEGYEDQR